MPIILRFYSVIALILATLLSSFSFAQAPDVSPTQNYVLELQKKAYALDLEHNRQWLVLGHWRSHFGGWLSEVDGTDFFLSSNGRKNPSEELDATLAAFAAAEPSDDHQDTQCRFLARRHWLYQALQIDVKRMPLHACANAMAWKQKLGADRVTLIFASAYLNNPASMFGHTFLKFHTRGNPDDKDLLNYGVSFAAHTGDDSGVPFALIGLLGGYKGYFSLLPYHQTLKEYANLEGRDVFEYQMDFTQDEVDILIDHLLELEQTYFYYFFFDKNCSYQLLALLEAARPSLHLTDRFFYFVIPADTVRVLTQENGLVKKISYRPSLTTQLQDKASELSSHERKLTRGLVTDKADAYNLGLHDLAILPEDRQARVLEAALIFSEEKLQANPPDFKERDHALKIKRATLGSVKMNETPAISHTNRQPELGHDPSLTGLSYGSKEAHSFEEFQLRAAYHSLLSKESGFLPGTQLEAMRAQARYYNDPSKWALEQFTIADIKSLMPIDEFRQPYSWRVDLGFKHLDDQAWDSATAFNINGGMGYSVEPFNTHRLLLFSFLGAHFDSAPDLEHGYRFALSGEASALLRASENWSGLLTAGYRRNFLGEVSDIPIFSLNQTYALSRNWEARLSFQDVRQKIESKGGLFVHFLF
jgi:hypothetical protein